MSRSDHADRSDPRTRRRRRKFDSEYYDGPAVADSLLHKDIIKLAARISKASSPKTYLEKADRGKTEGRNKPDVENVSGKTEGFNRYHGKVLRNSVVREKKHDREATNRSQSESRERGNVKTDFERMSIERIKEARSIVKGFREASVSQTTRERYRVLSDRLKRTGLTPEKIAGTKKSFYAYRAAEVFRYKSALKTALRDRDRAYRDKDLAEAQKAELRINESLEFFSRYQPGGTREENMQRQTRVRINETHERSNGKRNSMSYLPTDWREKVWRNSPKRDRDAIAVTALTGLRPSELEKGVRIRKVNESFEFRIQGSKVDERRQKGQAYRTITIPISELRNTVEGRHLIQAQRGQFRQVKLEGSAKAFSARVSRAGARALPGTDERVSPYTYRHAFSARLKSAGRSPEEIAKAMGHRAERSQQEYGRKGQAQNAGAGAIASASAARPVRGRR